MRYLYLTKHEAEAQAERLRLGTSKPHHVVSTDEGWEARPNEPEPAPVFKPKVQPAGFAPPSPVMPPYPVPTVPKKAEKVESRGKHKSR